MKSDQFNQFKVVVNHEAQYSLWQSGKQNAAGWLDTGVVGQKEECLAYVRSVWIDMRPLSLRRASAENVASRMASAVMPRATAQAGQAI